MIAAASAALSLRVLGATQRLVAIDKPAGLLAVPGRGPDKRDSVAARLQAMFPRAAGPLIVHRLDMETSGVIVAALDADTHRALSRQFEQREVDKRYEAIVHGSPGEVSGVVELKQRVDWPNRPRQIVDPERGKTAITRWRVISVERATRPLLFDRDAAGPDCRIEFEPITGRSHQIRLAAAAPPPAGLGCPILGDSLYGLEGDESERLMLHAVSLAVRDPNTGERLTFTSPAPF